MPRQNRVTPFGELIATSARGMFMGNRGILHDSDGQLTDKRWTHPHWIICQLEFKGRKRPLMSPGCYTELFFADEAVALAAGHRPCAECRREAFDRFKLAWIEGNPQFGFTTKTPIAEIDRILHSERVTRRRQKVTYEAQLGDLPEGTFFSLPELPGSSILVWEGASWAWAPEGYLPMQNLNPGTRVNVLTPKSTVNALRTEYKPVVELRKAS